MTQRKNIINLIIRMDHDELMKILQYCDILKMKIVEVASGSCINLDKIDDDKINKLFEFVEAISCSVAI